MLKQVTPDCPEIIRKHWIDYLRVSAILGVIMIHASAPFYQQFGKISQFDWWCSNILNSAGRFSVPVFVMISGAVLLGRPLTTVEFYKKRSKRLLIPIIFWTLFYIGFKVLIKGMDVDVNDLIYSWTYHLVIHGSASTHLWYLTMFGCLMLFAPFINNFINGDKPNFSDLGIFLGVTFVFFLLNGLSQVADTLFQKNIGWFKTFPWFIAYFVGGYYLDRYRIRILRNNSVILFSLISLILSGAVVNFYVADILGTARGTLVSITGPLVFIIAALVFSLAANFSSSLKENKIISTISEASFGMYLIHPVFLYFLRRELSGYDLSALIIMLIIIILTTIASLFSIIFIRKLPFLRNVC